MKISEKYQPKSLKNTHVKPGQQFSWGGTGKDGDSQGHLFASNHMLNIASPGSVLPEVMSLKKIGQVFDESASFVSFVLPFSPLALWQNNYETFVAMTK